MINSSSMVRRARRPAWLRSVRRRAEYDDGEGPRMLSLLARRIGDRASLVARRKVAVEYSAPVRDCYRSAPNDRAWRSEQAGRALWCIVDATSQRVLLEFVLAGPGAPSPTAVEQSIVAEAVRRLLDVESGDQRLALREDRALRPEQASLWRSNIDIVDALGQRATLQLLLAIADQPPPPQSAAAVDVGRVPLEVRCSLEPVRVSLSEVTAWKGGDLVPLPCAAQNLFVVIGASDATLGDGRLGRVGARRAIRVESVHLAQAS